MRTVCLIAIAALSLLAGGCAPRAHLMALRPAELDLAGVGRIAVLDFQGTGESGRIARSALLAQLSENRHFALVDQSELARIQPAAFQAGTPDESLVVHAARQAGVDAVLTGQVVSYNVQDDVQQDQHFSLAGGGGASSSGVKVGGLGIGFDSNTLHAREASVSLAFKLIDARNGEILAARQISHTFQGRVVNGQGQMPAREQVLNDLLRQCSRDVVAMIAPHYVPVEVVLARQTWGNGLTDLRRGNDLAKKGDWAGAEAAWTAALKRNPRNHAALHNLALASETKGDYAAAQRQIGSAIDAYAASLYHETRNRLVSSERDHAAARAQALARPAPAVPQNVLTSQPPQRLPVGNVAPAVFEAPSSTAPLPSETPIRLPPDPQTS
jgi:hypothetical protein